MNKIKTFYCQICKLRGKRFVGSRRTVREHIREDHRIKGKRKEKTGKSMPSKITSECIELNEL